MMLLQVLHLCQVESKHYDLLNNLYFLYYRTVKNPTITLNLGGLKDGNVDSFTEDAVQQIAQFDFDPMKRFVHLQ